MTEADEINLKNPAAPPSPICVVAAVNDEGILETNLCASPIVRAGAALHAMRGFSSAARAYNAGLDESLADVVVFAHQDVYFPLNWEMQLRTALRQLREARLEWSVLGLYGVRADGTHAGRVWSTGLAREIGASASEPIAVQSIDEMVIVLRRSSNLRFDDGLPGFHLYGTDIVQAALACGHGAYVIDAPAIHNSVPVRTLAGAYTGAYRYMRRKWRQALPIATPVTKIDRWGVSLWRTKLRLAGFGARKRRRLNAARAERPDPASIARSLGYE